MGDELVSSKFLLYGPSWTRVIIAGELGSVAAERSLSNAMDSVPPILYVNQQSRHAPQLSMFLAGSDTCKHPTILYMALSRSSLFCQECSCVFWRSGWSRIRAVVQGFIRRLLNHQ